MSLWQSQYQERLTTPDQAGYVHFGPHHWTKRSLIRRAGLVIAEIDTTMIRVHGDIYAHVSEFDHCVEGDARVIDQSDIEHLLAQIDPTHRDQMSRLISQIPQEPVASHFSPADRD